jgi:hypothetical protein
MNAGRIVSLVLLLLACPAFAWGDEVCLVPSLAVREEYNSNILLSADPNYVRKDYIATLSPGFEWTDRTERFDFLLSLRLDRHFYSRNDDLNATDQQYSGSVRYAATPLLSISAGAGFQKTSNPSLDAGPLFPGPQPGTLFLIPGSGGGTGGGGSDTGGGGGSTGNSNTAGGSSTSASMTTLPLIASPYQRISSSVSAEYQMTEKTSFTTGYQYGWDSYENPQSRDTTHDAQAGLVVDLGKYLPRVKGRLNAGYSQYLVYGQIVLPDSRTINVAGTIGFSYDVSETWNILVDGGYRRTDTETFVVVPVPIVPTPLGNNINVRERLDDAETAGTGDFSLNYNGQYTSVGLSYVQDFTMAYLASGHRAPAEREALSFTARHQMTRELSVSLTAGYTRYISEHVLTQTSVSVSPLIRYDLSQMSGERDLALEASYEHARLDYLVSGTAYRDLYFIRLTSRFPFCSSSQYK